MVESDIAVEVFIASDKYLLPDLKFLAEKLLISCITVENVVSFLQVILSSSFPLSLLFFSPSPSLSLLLWLFKCLIVVTSFT